MACLMSDLVSVLLLDHLHCHSLCLTTDFFLFGPYAWLNSCLISHLCFLFEFWSQWCSHGLGWLCLCLLTCTLLMNFFWPWLILAIPYPRYLSLPPANCVVSKQTLNHYIQSTQQVPSIQYFYLLQLKTGPLGSLRPSSAHPDIGNPATFSGKAAAESN